VANAHAKEEVLFDKRIIHRQLKEGRISRKDLDSRMKNLPDMEGESEDIAGSVFVAMDRDGDEPTEAN
jgi:hypothetical protein